MEGQFGIGNYELRIGDAALAWEGMCSMSLYIGAHQEWRQMGVLAALVPAPEDYLVDFTWVVMFSR
jgi:hypothetical protein